jgi:hypothetical protein
MHALGREVQLEQLDRDQPLSFRVVAAKYRSQGPRAYLMKNAKRSERIWRRAGGFGVQRWTPWERKARSW